jgi:hypothetical protein
MALILADDTIEVFERLSRFDLTQYFDDFATFVENDYSKIVNYFNGKVSKLDKDAINNFTTIRKQSSNLEDIVLNVSQNLDRMDYWNLLSFIDEVNSRIKVINKIDKFLRVIRYASSNENSMAVNYMTTDFDIPETVAAIDRANPQDDWVDIFTRNHILETDYLAEQGGLNLEIGRQSLRNLNLQSVVDNLQGENVYGKDIDQEFIFVDDDLKVLEPRDTVRQAIITLALLQKGDIPEFLAMGVSPDLAIGSNLGLVSIPFISKEMKQTFSTDDTLVNFQVLDVETKGSSIFINFQVQTFFDLVISDNIEIK